MLWTKAQEFAAEIVEMVVTLPRYRVTDVLCNQLLRSATSISANIAEGYGRYSQPAYRNHLSIARGSAVETESWLDLLQRRHYITDERCAAMIGKCDELQRLLTLRMKSLVEGKTYALKEEADEPYQV
jgi:four helix bundle protein